MCERKKIHERKLFLFRMSIVLIYAAIVNQVCKSGYKSIHML